MNLSGTYHAFTGAHDRALVLGHMGYVLDTVENATSCIPSSESVDLSLYATKDYVDAGKDLYLIYRDDCLSKERCDASQIPAQSIEAEYETVDSILSSASYAPMRRAKYQTLNDIFNGTTPAPLSREVKIKTLCRVLCASWLRFLSNWDQSTENLPKGERFIDFFCRWLMGEIAQEREFVTGFGAAEAPMGIPYFFERYFKNTGSELDGRRIVQTKTGRCGIAPSQTQQGDAIAFLANSGLPVMLRPKKTDREQEINNDIVTELRQQGRGVITLRPPQPNIGDHYPDEEIWKVPRDGYMNIVHYSVVGECFIDGCYGWSSDNPPKVEDMRVFALH